MISIHKKDCGDFISSLDSDSIDLILIDPPYIISKNSGYVNNAPDKKDYIAKYGKHEIDFGDWDKEPIDLEFILSESIRLLKDGGTFISFYDVWKMQEFRELAESVGFKQPRIGCWNKTNPVPINSKINYLSNAKEYFVSFTKKSKPTFNSSYDRGDYFVSLDDCDTYYYPILHGKERLKHPTQKPMSLISQLVEKHSNEGDVVLDFFAGTGTTGEASELLGRDSVLCEKDDVFFSMMESRLFEFNVQKQQL